MSVRSLVAFAMLFLSVDLCAGQLTIPEMVKLSSPNPVALTRSREMIPRPFAVIVGQADLIVEGRVTRQKSYLSRNQKDLLTDFVVTPSRVLAQRGNAPAAVRAPGGLSPVVMKQFGGQMVIDGVQVTDEDPDAPLLRDGQSVILVLVYNKTESKYELPGVAGAFTIQQDGLAPLIKAAPEYENFRGMTVAQFEAEIHRLGR